MKTVELYARVRHAVLIEGISERAAADRFGINARTVSKMLKFSVPPGYVRRKPPLRQAESCRSRYGRIFPLRKFSKIAFRDRYVDDVGHPLLQKLRGLV